MRLNDPSVIYGRAIYFVLATIELHHDLINLIWYLLSDTRRRVVCVYFFYFRWVKNIKSDGFIAEIRANDRTVSQFGLIRTEATFVYRTQIKSERKYFFFYIFMYYNIADRTMKSEIWVVWIFILYAPFFF